MAHQGGLLLHDLHTKQQQAQWWQARSTTAATATAAEVVSSNSLAANTHSSTTQSHGLSATRGGGHNTWSTRLRAMHPPVHAYKQYQGRDAVYTMQTTGTVQCRAMANKKDFSECCTPFHAASQLLCPVPGQQNRGRTPQPKPAAVPSLPQGSASSAGFHVHCAGLARGCWPPAPAA